MRPFSRYNAPTNIGAAILLAVLLAYVLWPSLSVLGDTVLTDPGTFAARESALTLDHWKTAFSGSNAEALVNSVTLSLISTLLAGILGGALAVFYTRWEFPGRPLFAAAAILPLTLPPLVGVFAFWRMLNENGLLPRMIFAATGWQFKLESGWVGVYLVHSYSFSVYFYLLLSAALRLLDGSTLEAARSLGASRRRVLFRVALPQLTPALAGASLLVFMASMASFTAPLIYVRARNVLTVNIFLAYQDNRIGQASILCVMMTAVSILILVALQWWNARTKHYSAGKGVPPRRIAAVSRIAKAGLCALGAIVSLLLALPHLYIVFESLIRSGTWFTEVFPREFTLENYAKILSDPDSTAPVIVSLKAAAIATAAVAAFGLLAAWMTARKRFLGRRMVMALVMLPWALPGTVIAINLLGAFNSPSILTAGQRIYGTISILTLAYFVRYIPLTYRSTLASIETMDPGLEEAAQGLGASRARTLWKITLPLIAPGLLSGTLLVFVTALGEFVSSILLAGEAQPVSVHIYGLLRVRYELAAAYSALLMGLILITLAASSKLFKTGGVRI